MPDGLAERLTGLAAYFAKRRAPAHLVEDAAGAFLLGAVRAWGRADANRDPHGYAVVAGLNAVRDLLRQEQRQHPEAMAILEAPRGPDGDASLRDAVPDDRTPAPDAALLAEDAAASVRRAVQRLPEKERAVIEMLYFTGRRETVRTAGARLGVSRQSVSTWHRQALTSLRADPSIQEIA